MTQRELQSADTHEVLTIQGARIPAAGTFRRIMAYVLDSMLLGIIIFLGAFMASSQTGIQEISSESMANGKFAAWFLIPVLVVFLGQVILMGLLGQTVGRMIVLTAKVRYSTGGPVGIWRALCLSLLVRSFSPITPLAQLIVVLRNGERRGWTDLILDSAEIKIPQNMGPFGFVKHRIAEQSPESAADKAKGNSSEILEALTRPTSHTTAIATGVGVGAGIGAAAATEAAAKDDSARRYQRASANEETTAFNPLQDEDVAALDDAKDAQASGADAEETSADTNAQDLADAGAANTSSESDTAKDAETSNAAGDDESTTDVSATDAEDSAAKDPHALVNEDVLSHDKWLSSVPTPQGANEGDASLLLEGNKLPSTPTSAIPIITDVDLADDAPTEQPLADAASAKTEAVAAEDKDTEDKDTEGKDAEAANEDKVPASLEGNPYFGTPTQAPDAPEAYVVAVADEVEGTSADNADDADDAAKDAAEDVDAPAGTTASEGDITSDITADGVDGGAVSGRPVGRRFAEATDAGATDAEATDADATEGADAADVANAEASAATPEATVAATSSDAEGESTEGEAIGEQEASDAARGEADGETGASAKEQIAAVTAPGYDPLTDPLPQASAAEVVTPLGGEPVVGDSDESTIEQRIHRYSTERANASLTFDTGLHVKAHGAVHVGRNPQVIDGLGEAELVIIHDQAMSMSKTHARLEFYNDHIRVIDLGSTNGTYIQRADGVAQRVLANDSLTMHQDDTVYFGQRACKVTLEND